MRNLLRLFALLIAFSCSMGLRAQWTNLGTQSYPIQMTSDYHGFRVSQHETPSGSAGPVWKFWETQDDWVTEGLFSSGGGSQFGCCPVEAITFLNDSVGFMEYLSFGYKNVIVTHDRGLSWNTLMATGSPFSLMPTNDGAIFALDDTTVYVVGQNFAMDAALAYRLSPSGVDTVLHDTNLVGTVSRILFLDRNRGFVISDADQGLHRLLRTVDGGATWSVRLTIGIGSLHVLDFVSDSIGYVAGDNGVFYKTTDAGFTWTSLAANGPVNVRSMDFLDENVGWLGCTDGLLLRTTSGGNLWDTEQLDSAATVRYVRPITATKGYAQTSDSVLYKREYVVGATEAASASLSAHAYPNPSSGIVHIEAEGQMREWRLLDLQGRVMQTGKGLEVDLGALARGTYVLEVVGMRGVARLRLVRA